MEMPTMSQVRRHFAKNWYFYAIPVAILLVVGYVKRDAVGKFFASEEEAEASEASAEKVDKPKTALEVAAEAEAKKAQEKAVKEAAQKKADTEYAQYVDTKRVHVVWNVDLPRWNSKKRKGVPYRRRKGVTELIVGRWNPIANNEAKGAVLIAFNTAGMPAREVIPFSADNLKKHKSYIALVFEDVTNEKYVDLSAAVCIVTMGKGKQRQQCVRRPVGESYDAYHDFLGALIDEALNGMSGLDKRYFLGQDDD